MDNTASCQKTGAWKQPSERLEPLVIPCLSVLPFLSLLVCFLLFDEVRAANPILSLLITRLHCNALQSFLLFVENSACFCKGKMYCIPIEATTAPKQTNK